ncbi:hypothetical protein G7Y89_g6498 [Cudoniella acicularis]|uniref:C6 transcription factor n=1 Tax=Cudoniella acicularis TaxID=354080 RepID=A0A8H4RMJ9_9HELO|nr:hypothetical protein G7Y89_g6498 [Cudoniella acicularis]
MVTSPTKSLSTSLCSFSSTPESHRLLELELMHRWSTRTWAGLSSIPEDQVYLQDCLPRAALGSTYLMNGILAIAAVDLALSFGETNSAKYIRAALEYSNKGSAEFRTHLCNINTGNMTLLYYFASLAAVYNWAVPSEHMSTLDRLTMAFDMLLGAFNIALTNIHWLCQNHSTFGAVLSYGTVTMDILDLDTRIALNRLTTVSDQLRISTSSKEIEGSRQEPPFAGELVMYRIAIAQLKYSFAEDARGAIKGYCLSLITAAGSDFSLAMKNMEPMALFIVMYFGVLLDRMASDPMCWWIASAGKELVDAISEILLQTPLAEIQDGLEGIAWTRQQVGLPVLLSTVVYPSN